MQTHDNPFPLSGDNFRTLARVDADLELSLMILELGFPVLVGDGCTYDELAVDYAVALAEFERQIGAGKCTDTVKCNVKDDLTRLL